MTCRTGQVPQMFGVSFEAHPFFHSPTCMFHQKNGLMGEKKSGLQLFFLGFQRLKNI